MTHARVLSTVAAALLLGGCTAQRTPAQTTPTRSAPSANQRTARVGYTRADVEFMQGMIGHHAQAITMGKMCPSHGASAQLRVFCDKVIRSQRDEIDLMQTWLRDNGEAVPDPDDPHAMHMMNGMAMGDHATMDSTMKMDSTMHMDMSGHEMLMPGMLTAAQLAQLDSARGTDFDRLFLTGMIRHHEGALTMVAKLFDTPGAGQTPEIFGYATGVDADQRAEIERMQRMLTTITGRTPQ